MRASCSVAPVFLALSAISFASCSKAPSPSVVSMAGNPYPSAGLSNLAYTSESLPRRVPFPDTGRVLVASIAIPGCYVEPWHKRPVF